MRPPATRRSASSTTSGSTRRRRGGAADEAGIELRLLYVAYARGGLPRFRQPSAAEYLAQVEELRADGLGVGVAPHSVRACPRDWLEESAATPRPRTALHVHADEQPREIEECLAEHGQRPIELLAETGCLGPQTTVVHATHADGAELDLSPTRRACLRLPDDRGQPRRRLPPGRALSARDRALHRLRLERPDRPARGAARARGDRPAPAGRRGVSQPTRCSARPAEGGAARSGSRLGRRRGRPGSPFTRTASRRSTFARRSSRAAAATSSSCPHLSDQCRSLRSQAWTSPSRPSTTRSSSARARYRSWSTSGPIGAGLVTRSPPSSRARSPNAVARSSSSRSMSTRTRASPRSSASAASPPSRPSATAPS